VAFKDVLPEVRPRTDLQESNNSVDKEN
jgi:hypothetical protein